MTRILILCFFLLTDKTTVYLAPLSPLPSLPVAVISDVVSFAYEIYNVLVGESIDSVMAEIIVAQAVLESGNFGSNLAKKHNNFFGMMHPHIRPTTSLGPWAKAEGRRGYASYCSVKESTLDLILWLRYNKIGTICTTYSYSRTLKKYGYFGSNVEDYRRGLNFYKKRKF